jgi:replicative DNA helicase
MPSYTKEDNYPNPTREQYFERPLPNSADSERAILGAIILDNGLISHAIEQLKPDDFYVPANRRIFVAMTRLFERGSEINELMVSEELKKEASLESVGGIAGISNLTYGLPHYANIESFSNVVRKKALARNLVKVCNKTISEVLEEEEEPDIILDHAEQAIFALADERIRQGFAHIKPVAEKILEQVEEMSGRKVMLTGLTTGFTDIDQMTSGLQPSDMIIIAARPSAGKTSLCLTLAQNAAIQANAVVAVFSLEMSKEALVMRMLCSEARVDAHRFRSGFLARNEWPQLASALATLSEAKIYIDDTPGISVLEMRAKARRLAAEQKQLDLIIVDYLQLMSGSRRTESRQQEVSQISRELKALAKEMNVPVIALSQLSRASETRTDHRPVLSDLRESGCVVGDTLITLADSGKRIPIRELVGKKSFAVWALNEETFKIERAIVSKAFATGVKPVYRMVTRLGREIRATGNHKFYTLSGWKRLDELRVGERMALPRSIPTPKKQTMSDAELALLGQMIGDGCALPRHVTQYTTREKDLAETVERFAKEVFGNEVNPRINPERNWYQVYLTSTRRHTHGVRSAVTEWLDGLGVYGLRSYEKRVPEKVFRQPQEAITVFLRHLWATDGAIWADERGEHHPSIYYTSSSERLSRDVQSLLLRLGINARLFRVSQKGKGRDQFNVFVSGKEDIEKFIQKIKSVGEYKTKALQKVDVFIQKTKANPNRGSIPSDVWRKYVVPAMQANGLTTRKMMASINTRYCGTELYKQNLSRERAMRVANAVYSHELLLLSQSDIYWDEITSIEPDGSEEVFDLTVDKLHNFVGNDVFVHNSLEQDSDVVAFIYREEQYNRTEENAGIAEIIIAKQRNGPTGTVKLAFLKEFTRFENMWRE